MGKTAFLFPGQGAQYIGMGSDFYEHYPECREQFHRAGELLDLDLCKLCFEENQDLNITEYTQAAMITMISAVLDRVKALGIKADVCAGLSLGEYAALYAAGVLSFEDAICLVRKRGIFMQNEVPNGLGAMAAVLGLEKEKIEEICKNTDGIVSIANYNCPGQIVISGETEAVKLASEGLSAAGAKRVVPLNVSGPFHSLMLKGAGEKLAVELEKAVINRPLIPYVANVTAMYVTEEEPIKKLLKEQVYSSVRWQQSIECMIADGVDTFIEIGPGKTLSQFVKKIDKTVKIYNVDHVEDLEKLPMQPE